MPALLPNTFYIAALLPALLYCYYYLTPLQHLPDGLTAG